MKRKAKLPRRRSAADHPDVSKHSTVKNCNQSNYQVAEAGAPLVQKDLASLKATTEIPPSSFEFYVWSDEGINLHVNLNSSPSDWTNRFKKEVYISENVHQNKSCSFWQEISCLVENSTIEKSSFLPNMKSNRIEIHKRHMETQPSVKLINDVTKPDQHDIGDSSSISDTSKPFSNDASVEDKLKDDEAIVMPAQAASTVDNFKEGQSTVSSEIDYGAHNNVMSGAESCAKDESKDSGTTFISSMSGSFLNCVSYPDKLERYNSKPGSEISEDFTQLNGSCCLIPCAACPGVSASSSADLQISEVASCHKHASASLSENDGTLDIMNPKKMPYTESLGVVNSSKFNLDTDGNNTEEWELGKTVNGRESSECSQFGDPLKSGPVSDDRDSKVELQRKRKRKDSKVQGHSAEPLRRILRSMKAPRRSIRLICQRKGP